MFAGAGKAFIAIHTLEYWAAISKMIEAVFLKINYHCRPQIIKI